MGVFTVEGELALRDSLRSAFTRFTGASGGAGFGFIGRGGCGEKHRDLRLRREAMGGKAGVANKPSERRGGQVGHDWQGETRAGSRDFGEGVKRRRICGKGGEKFE